MGMYGVVPVRDWDVYSYASARLGFVRQRDLIAHDRVDVWSYAPARMGFMELCLCERGMSGGCTHVRAHGRVDV